MSKYLTDDDGWNKEHLDETGISDFFDNCSAVEVAIFSIEDNIKRESK